MADTVDELQARRAKLVAKYEKVSTSWASHSTGDRSYANWDPATIRREIEDVDRKLAALQSPESSGRTVLRLGRGR